MTFYAGECWAQGLLASAEDSNHNFVYVSWQEQANNCVAFMY